MKYDVLVIGGGAAGLTAALSASRQGARVLVLEAANRVGRKILASGNGHCNLANMGPARYPGGAEFAKRVLSLCPVSQVLDFFHSLGLITVVDDGGRVYPGCGQAAVVLDTLRGELDRRGVETVCDCPVSGIEPAKWGMKVIAKTGVFFAPCVIAAFGGPAGGRLGHDGSPYRLLTNLGHTLIPPRPALSPLFSDPEAVKGLSGLRLPAILTLCAKLGPRAGEAITEPQLGEAMFTDNGVSGMCAMELARAAQDEKERSGVWPILFMDFAPILGLCERRYGLVDDPDPFRHLRAVEALLRERAHILPRGTLLRGMVPRLLAERLKYQSTQELARSLAAFPVPLTGVRGLDGAQVTAGGISRKDFDNDTLQSTLVPGLFAAGELLDVDGACGGFNLQFAFASGILAGKNAAEMGIA